MVWVLLVVSSLLLLLGHLFKVYRWQQFIEIYEKPKTNNLLQSLSLSYIINFFVPFRIGDLFRIWYSGKKMKNGISFSLTTVIIDRILDVFCVGIIFFTMYILGVRQPVIINSMIFYLLAILIILFIMVISLLFNKIIKNIIRWVASIFNTNIELKILKISYFGITSFKDISTNLNKFKLVINTVLIWFFYLSSYCLFAKSLEYFNYNYSFVEVISSLFSNNTLNISILGMFKGLEVNILYPMFLFISLPLIFMLALSFFVKRNSDIKSKNENIRYLELLPHTKPQDKLTFLEAYFSGKSRDFFKIYLKLNQDISILQDYSAGSNATTLLCIKDKDTFFRKYSIGKDSEKLYEQAKWLQNHQDLNVTKVLNVKKGNNYCCYDMPYYNNAIGYFNFVHSTTITTSWNLIKKTLDDLNNKLYTKNIRKADKETIEKYIEDKVNKNLKKIENGNYIKPLLKYDILIINGKKYKNLKYFKKFLTKEYLYEIFKNDKYSDIHGDLTIENIINKGKSYYIIDPNTGNLHESSFLDYSKLLQSLHGNYEFYMNTKSVEINGNQINYLFTKSYVYQELFNEYYEYLKAKFSDKEIKSIFYHEIVHWLRLLPYKIDKNGIRSVLFYAGLIIVLNDVIEMCGE